MELTFNRGIQSNPDKLSHTITFFQKNFMVLNCTFDIGFESADSIIFSVKENGDEILRIVLKDCMDLYMPESNMININKLIAKQKNSIEITIVEHSDKPFDLTLTYI
ncbi:MAG: hypothetical protein HYU69_08145 [Bacteroidetes bacterium]|nr:hypothetical protein [Bacteroidota bacterium]